MTPLLHVRELVQDRSLLFAFVRQDLRLKYRGSLLGYLWAMLNPLMTLVVMTVAFTFIFSNRYPLHLFAALLPWQFFHSSQIGGCNSLISSANITLNWKTPLLIFPVRHTLYSFCEYVFALVGLGVIACFIGFRLSPSVMILPYSMLLLLIFSMSLSIIMSVLAVHFRDTQHLVDVAMRAWMYISPVIIPAESFPENHRWVLTLNPMYYFLELFDAPIARAEWPASSVILTATVITLLTTSVSLAVFDRYESKLVFRM